MKEPTHLFTPVSEGLPEYDDYYACLDEHGNLSSQCLPFNKRITHWLDLSKLTTKAKAEELIKKGFEAGENYALDKYGADNMPNLPDFIAQNIKKL